MAPAAAPTRSHRFGALAFSLLIAAGFGPWAAGRPAGAAELLKMRLEGLEIPIHLDQLEAWNGQAGARVPSDNDLTPWLGLLDPTGRADLRRMLTSPLLSATAKAAPPNSLSSAVTCVAPGATSKVSIASGAATSRIR